MDVKLEIQRSESRTIITINGEIDLYNANELKDKVNREMEGISSPMLIMDLKDVDYIDSTGLGILIGIKRRATEGSGKLVLVLRSDRIFKLFEITGLSSIFTITRSIEDAISSITSAEGC